MSSVLSEEGEGDVLKKPMFFFWRTRWGEGGAIKPAVWMDFAAGFLQHLIYATEGTLQHGNPKYKSIQIRYM